MKKGANIRRVSYSGKSVLNFEDINFDYENQEVLQLCFKSNTRAKFTNCTFNDGICLEGICDKIEFVDCHGKIIDSNFTSIYINVKSSDITFERSNPNLLSCISLHNDSIVTIKGPGVFTANNLKLNQNSEFIIESSKAVFDRVSLSDNSIITLDDRFDDDYPDLVKECMSKNERPTCLWVLECTFSEGFMRSIGSNSICFNGHMIGPVDERMCDKNGCYRNSYMSISYKCI